MTSPKRSRASLALYAALLLSGCTPGTGHHSPPSGIDTSTSAIPRPVPPYASSAPLPVSSADLLGMPAPLATTDVYAADRPGLPSASVAHHPAYVYVPDSLSGDV